MLARARQLLSAAVPLPAPGRLTQVEVTTNLVMATVDQSPNPSVLNLAALSDGMLGNGWCTHPRPARLRVEAICEACGFFNIEIPRPPPWRFTGYLPFGSPRVNSRRRRASAHNSAVLLHRASANVPIPDGSRRPRPGRIRISGGVNAHHEGSRELPRLAVQSAR